MKKTITHWLFMEFDYHAGPDNEYNGGKYWAPVLKSYRPEEDESRIFIRSMQVDVDVPDNFDPTAKQIAALEAKREKATAAYQAMVREINTQISKLQALTFEPSEAA